MTALEECMLLEILELNVNLAHEKAVSWRNQPLDEYSGDAQALQGEVSFADGAHYAWLEAKRLIERVINENQPACQDLPMAETRGEDVRLVQVGWRYPFGGFMHGMEWKSQHPEHVEHDKCVPVYVKNIDGDGHG